MVAAAESQGFEKARIIYEKKTLPIGLILVASLLSGAFGQPDSIRQTFKAISMGQNGFPEVIEAVESDIEEVRREEQRRYGLGTVAIAILLHPNDQSRIEVLVPLRKNFACGSLRQLHQRK